MKSKSLLFSNYSIHRAAAADVSFMGNGVRGRFARNASRRPDVDPDGYFDVIAHGEPQWMYVENRGQAVKVSARQAAKIIKKQPGFRKAKGVRLLSCDTGSNPEGFAQHLANALGKPVMAPTKCVWALPNGKMWVADRRNIDKGTFIIYKPGGIKHG